MPASRSVESAATSTGVFVEPDVVLLPPAHIHELKPSFQGRVVAVPVHSAPSHTKPASQRVTYIGTSPSGLKPAYTVPSAHIVPTLGELVQSPAVVTFHVLLVFPALIVAV